LRGGEQQAVVALRQGDLVAAQLPANETALLQYVRLLTVHSYKASSGDVTQLERHGWSRDQITECVYVTALFALFNRISDAFGLQDPNYDQVPADSRPTNLAERIDTELQ